MIVIFLFADAIADRFSEPKAISSFCAALTEIQNRYLHLKIFQSVFDIMSD